MAEHKNSHPLHFPLHPFILLSVLEKPHKLLFPSVFVLHPLSSRCFWYTDTLFALLPTLLPPPSAGILLNLAAACFSAAYICSCCLFPLQAKPQTLSLTPSTETYHWLFSLHHPRHVPCLQGYKKPGIILILALWSWECCLDILALGVTCSHVQE